MVRHPLRCLAFVNASVRLFSNNLIGIVQALGEFTELRVVEPYLFPGYRSTGGAAPSKVPSAAVDAGLEGGFQPDIVACIGGGHYLSDEDQKRFSPSCVFVGFALSDPLGAEATEAIAPKFDLYYSQDPQSVAIYRAKGLRVGRCDPAVDPRTVKFKPMPKDLDVIFVGKWTPLRNALISRLSTIVRVGVFTNDGETRWDVEPLGSLPSPESLSLAFSRAHLALEVARVENQHGLTGFYRLTNRTQFAALCFVPSLIEPFPFLSDFFEPGEEIETYSDEEELVEKVLLLLSDGKRREEMGARAHRRVLLTATWRQRLAMVFADIEACRAGGSSQLRR